MVKIRRRAFSVLMERLGRERRFLQVLAGPRQVGKTTVALQVGDNLRVPNRYAAADAVGASPSAWLETEWEKARSLASRSAKGAVLFLDEVQKIPDWSALTKKLWDEDTRRRLPLHVVLLGSSQLLLMSGLSESLAGRFETIYVPHWSFKEMRDAFGFSIEEFVTWGSYPGAASLVSDRGRFLAYVRDSLIETTVSRDILYLVRVDKPALLRRLFEFGCIYSGQILSYQKMLGQMQEGGNVVTLVHYLKSLAGAGLLAGLPRFSGSHMNRRGSSPKLLALNNALVTALRPGRWAGIRGAGPSGRDSSRCPPSWSSPGLGVRAVMVARSESRGGLRHAQGTQTGGYRSEERRAARGLARARLFRPPASQRAAIAGGRRWHRSRNLPARRPRALVRGVSKRKMKAPRPVPD